ncbi:TPA: hypothetical protein ACFNMH_000406 [Neisseria elongata]
MHYQSLNAALEQYSSSLAHHPSSPNSLVLHIDRQTQGRLKLHTPHSPPPPSPRKPGCNNCKPTPRNTISSKSLNAFGQTSHNR